MVQAISGDWSVFCQLCIIVLQFSFLSGTALAQNKPQGAYAAGFIGSSTFYDVEANGEDVDFAPFGILASGNLGYHFEPNTRLEAELLFETAEIDGSNNNVGVIRGTLSGYYEFEDLAFLDLWDLRPYAGGGIGFAKVEIDDIENNEFTWHAETGLSVPIDDETLDFVPGLRFEYIFLDDDDGFDGDLWVIQLRAGLRYYF